MLNTSIKSLTLSILLGFFSISNAEPANAVNLLTNPGFENSSGNTLTGWSTYHGACLPISAAHSGAQAALCNSSATTAGQGVEQTITLKQSVALPVIVSGWSAANGASGTRDDGYSIYIDVYYMDGTRLYGQTFDFMTGTHGWQQGFVYLVPPKPIKTLDVYAMFTHAAGNASFDDMSVQQVSPGDSVVYNLFDSQVLTSPQLAVGQNSGWFARDVSASSPLVGLDTAGSVNSLGFQLTNISSPSAGITNVTLVDTLKQTRAMTLYYVQKVADPTKLSGVLWWNDISQSAATNSLQEFSNYAAIPGLGAINAMSYYPFGCVTASNSGTMIGIPPNQNPSVARIFFDGSTGLMVVAYDFGLTPAKSTAPVGIMTASTDPTWGFRSAAALYYNTFPNAFTRKAAKDGIWLVGTDSSKITNVSDFDIAYHEEDNTVSSDNSLGVYSFRYSEPQSYWMTISGTNPTYTTALSTLNANAAKSVALAQATLNSGLWTNSSGVLNGSFPTTAWKQWLWLEDPNPYFSYTSGEITKASLVYNIADANLRYGSANNGGPSGEYLDSLEGWGDVFEYNPQALNESPEPLSFASDTLQPALPNWFNVYDLTRFMSNDLHGRQKLLMANGTLIRFWIYAPWLDVLGTEINWMSDGVTYTPDSDTVFNYRRTMSYHKPYLLLMDTDFNAFN